MLASGHDFYASPVFSPRADQLAYIAWDHPNMPWNGTVLETIEWGNSGAAGQARGRAGGESESLFQPRYSEDGALLVVTDASGYWNLARLGDEGLVSMHSAKAEFGRAQWVFGMSSWTFLSGVARSGDPIASRGSGGRVLASATYDGLDRLVELDLGTGETTAWPSPFASAGGLQSGDGWVAWIAGTPKTPSALYVCRVGEVGEKGASPAPVCVRESATLEFSESALSVAEARVFESKDGRRTHAFVYLPNSDRHAAAPGERPPLLVKSHGGPTSATSAGPRSAHSVLDESRALPWRT